MPARGIKQPNGLYARFSTVVDDFTDWDCTREELWNIFQDEGGITFANRKMESADQHTYRFEEALRIIGALHGREKADEYRDLLTKL